MYTHSLVTLTLATAMIEKVSNEVDSYSGLGCFAVRVKVSGQAHIFNATNFTFLVRHCKSASRIPGARAYKYHHHYPDSIPTQAFMYSFLFSWQNKEMPEFVLPLDMSTEAVNCSIIQPRICGAK